MSHRIRIQRDCLREIRDGRVGLSVDRVRRVLRLDAMVYEAHSGRPYDLPMFRGVIQGYLGLIG